MENLTGKTIDHYHILEELGQGSHAVVYKAQDMQSNDIVALKFIDTDKFPAAMLLRMLKDFEHEASALMELLHRSIVAVLGYGAYGQVPYLVMEYMAGGSLRERLGKPMPYAEAAALLKPVAEALEYVNKAGRSHENVKPSNILFTSDGLPMLGDVGMARLLALDETTPITGMGMSAGAPAYMAPEQWRGQAGPAADVYALGVILYEMLTGQAPFQAQTALDLAAKKAAGALPDPRKLAPDLPDGVVAALQKTLAANPEARYTGAAELAAALDAALKKRRFSLGLALGIGMGIVALLVVVFVLALVLK